MTRALLVLACLILFALCLLGMRQGWLNRGRRQDDVAPLPPSPADPGVALLEPMTGLYVGSTAAGHWQDRVVARNLGVRADATATLTAAGVLIDRTGAAPVFIPAATIVGAGVGAGLAGKVLGPGGLLIIRWRLSDDRADSAGTELDTGLRADDKSVYTAWVDALDRMAVST